MTTNMGIFATRVSPLQVNTASADLSASKTNRTRSPEDKQQFDSLLRASLTSSPGPVDPDNSNTMKVALDLNNDGTVNMSDLGIQLANTGGKDMSYDHNHDGVVDSKDVDLLVSFWGTEGNMIVSSPDINQDGNVDINDLSQMLAHFGSEDEAYDLNNDGVNDQKDIDVLLSFWGSENI